MSLENDIAGIKLILEEEEDVFKPASREDLNVRKEHAYQRKKEAFLRMAQNWKVNKLTVEVPAVQDDQYSGMHDWWRNNKQWKNSNIKKVDEEWGQVTFFFKDPMSTDEATKLINEFIQDWAHKPATQDKALAVDDAVYLDTGDRWNRDSGKIVAVEGDKIKVRFHHHGNTILSADRFNYDRENNAWNVPYDQEFKDQLTKKKGVPKIGVNCMIELPISQIVPPQAYRREQTTEWGKVTAVDGDMITVEYRPPRDSWQDPQNPPTTKQIKLSDLIYDWRGKYWKERSVEND